MYRLAVCDDEPVFLKSTRELAGHVLDELELDYEILSFAGAAPLQDALAQGRLDCHALLLDIDLGHAENGIQIAQAMRAAGYTGGIIFTTAYRDYALDGYRVQPIQYLLKPLDAAELRGALALNIEQTYRRRHIILNTREGTRALPISDIFFIEIMGHTATFHTTVGAVACPARLKDLETRLADDHFVRCHKSFLVNLNKVQNIRRYAFLLKNGATVPISKNFYTASQTAFIRFHNR